MSVSNGQIANATTFNNAFISRTADSDTTGKINLNNASSTAVTDVQAVINTNKTNIANSQTDITNLQNTRVIKAASSTDEAIVRFDGTTGQTVQNSLVTISDTGSMTVPENLTVSGNLTVNGTLTNVNSTNLDVTDKNITVNKNGSDITADGAGLTVDRVGTDGSLVYEDALASKWKAGALGAEIQLANVSSTQTFTNKTIVAASNTITTAASGNLTSTNINAALAELQGDIDAIGSPANYILKSTVTTKGDLIAATASATVARLGVGTNNQVLTADSAEATGLKWADATGGSGGAKNLITNGSADNSLVTIFVPYADAAASRPVDGTGGVPTVTTTITSTVPLDGTKSYLLAKPASNVQGQGWSVPFTVDPAYRAKVLTINFDYIVNSGTFVAGSPTTDSDVIWYIYDVTNATLIEPSSIKMLASSTTISDKFSASFQTSATGASYRLIAHVATTSAVAYELKVDNVTVSPSNYVFGTPITDWQTFTPTGTWVTNTTYTGRYRRIGDTAEIQYNLILAGAPNAVQLTLNMPAGLTIDTSKFPGTILNDNSVLGDLIIKDSGTNSFLGTIAYGGTTSTLLPGYMSQAATVLTAPAAINATSPITFAVNDQIGVTARVPIVGWSSSVQTSDQADTRVVSFRTNQGGVSQTGINPNASAVKIEYNTIEEDTHGAYSAANDRFTVPVSGKYVFNAAVVFNSTNVLANNYELFLYKNGAQLISGNRRTEATATTFSRFLISPPIDSKVGDYYEIFIFGTGNNSATPLSTNNNQDENYFGGYRVSGPSAIAASESISARYTSAAGQSIANAATPIIDFGTRSRDTHVAVTTGASWKFTAPTSGEYRVVSHVSFANATFTAGNGINLSIFKNNSVYSVLAQNTVQSTTTLSAFSLIGSDTIYLLAGEFIDLRIAHGEAAARSLLADATRVRVSITRIGS